MRFGSCSTPVMSSVFRVAAEIASTVPATFWRSVERRVAVTTTSATPVGTVEGWASGASWVGDEDNAGGFI